MTKPRQLFWLVVMGSIFLAICFVGLHLMFGGMGDARNGFEDWARSELDPLALQRWSTNLLTRALEDLYSAEALAAKYPPGPESHVPDHLVPTNLAYWGQAPDCIFQRPQGRVPYILIVYGSGHGHWGIEVGGPAFQQADHGYTAYQLWTNGVYFWKGM